MSLTSPRRRNALLYAAFAHSSLGGEGDATESAREFLATYAKALGDGQRGPVGLPPPDPVTLETTSELLGALAARELDDLLSGQVWEQVLATVEDWEQRPSLTIDRQGQFFMPGAIENIWTEELPGFNTRLRPFFQSIGRVKYETRSGWAVGGTCFVAGHRSLVTCRHVLKVIQARQYGTGKNAIGVDFLGSDGPPDVILSEVTYEPDEEYAPADRSKVDVCVLSVGDDQRLPAPIPIDGDTSGTVMDRKIGVIGFPSEINGEVPNDIDLKKFAPGHIIGGLGSFDEDAIGHTFKHDATTGSDNSGSPVFDLSGAMLTVIGVHCGGRAREANYAQSLRRIKHLLPAEVSESINWV